MIHLLDKSGRQKFRNLFADGPALLFVEAPQTLLHRLGVGRISRECSATSLGMPGMSKGLHAKMSALARRKSTSTTSYLSSRVELTLNILPSLAEGSRGTSFVPSAGSKAPAWRDLASAASFAILSKSAARASS